MHKSRHKFTYSVESRGLGENIRQHVRGAGKFEGHGLVLENFPKEVVADVDVFATLGNRHRIGCCYGALVVAMHE